MEYVIAKYDNYHAAFRTDEFYEVYRYDGPDDRGEGIAFFAYKTDAEAFVKVKEGKE